MAPGYVGSPTRHAGRRIDLMQARNTFATWGQE